MLWNDGVPDSTAKTFKLQGSRDISPHPACFNLGPCERDHLSQKNLLAYKISLDKAYRSENKELVISTVFRWSRAEGITLIFFLSFLLTGK